jgi:plastocyanin
VHTKWKACILAGKFIVVSALFGSPMALEAQELMDVTASIKEASGGESGEALKLARPPAAIWLTSLDRADYITPDKSRTYTLLQKNKQFTPHLLVVPVGSIVHFPNEDPFFHNVFSLFDGRRFDLGLYEAGSSREVAFAREGVSYIFCNIHPEMSAVVIALATPFYGVEGKDGRIHISGVPAGEYLLHVWAEGEDQVALNALNHRVRVAPDHADLGLISLPQPPHPARPHENIYGQKYETREPSIY